MKQKRRGQPSGMRQGAVRSIVARCPCVQRHISFPSPQSIMRCDRVSSCTQWVQWAVSARAILWRLSLSGRMSWITMYHWDRTVSGTQAASRLLQILCQSTLRCSISTRHGLAGVTAEAIMCSARYRRVRIFLIVSSDVGSGT